MKPRIFELNEDVEHFDGLTFVDPELFWSLRNGGVRALAQLPAPILVELNTDEVYKRPPPLADCVWLTSGVCCFSVKAWTVLNERVVVRGPIARLAFGPGKAAREFILFEPDRKFDCLNFERSKVQYSVSSPKYVTWVDNIVLQNADSVDEDVFAVEHLPWTVFCTEKVERVVKAAGLTGFCFDPVKVI